VRKRAGGKVQTDTGIRTAKIVDIVSRFSLLHAYGVGLDVFRQLPEQQRMRGIEYAKWLLAFALDDEIDSAYLFFKALHCDRFHPKSENFVCSAYLEYMYGYWRQLSGTCDKEVPLGAYIVAGLLSGQRIFFTKKSKPGFYMTIPLKRRTAMEGYLERHFDFKRWPDEDFKFLEIDERVGDMENSLQSADALENVKVEENG